MSNESYKDLFGQLESSGLFEFGRVINGSFVREILGLKMPEIAPKKVYDQIALTELGAIDYCKNILLGRGMYIARQGDNYRILLPSENKEQIDSYMRSADRKLRRALKLSKSTPVEHRDRLDNTNARILMKRESIRTNFNQV